MKYLVAALILVGMPLSAFAASVNGFPQGYAGAVMNHDMYNFYMERNASYLNRPMSPADFKGAPDDDVNVEPGVIPYHSHVQGVVRTPSGNVMITPGGE